MARQTILAIDPGATGAIAVVDTTGLIAACRLARLTEYDIRGLLENVEDAIDLRVYLEQVGPNRSRKEGERRQGASSMFAFGRNYGFLRGLLVGFAIPFVDVRPIEWQRGVGIAPRANESYAEKKRRHRGLAQQLWPRASVTLETCDALLIAEYGRRQWVQQTAAATGTE